MTDQEMREVSETIALNAALHAMEILKETDLYNSDTQCVLDEKGLMEMGCLYGIERQKNESLPDFRARLVLTIKHWRGDDIVNV